MLQRKSEQRIPSTGKSQIRTGSSMTHDEHVPSDDKYAPAEDNAPERALDVMALQKGKGGSSRWDQEKEWGR